MLILGFGGASILRFGGLTLDNVKQASCMPRITFIASAFGVLLALWFACLIWWQKPLDALLYFVRAAHLWNGVSPLRPLLFVGIAALWLSVSELWRLSLSEEYVLTNDFLGFGNDGSFTGIGAHERVTVDLLKCSTNKIPFFWLWIALPFVVYLLLDFPGIKLIALDGRFFTWFFILIAFFVYTSLLLFFGRFIAVWFKLSALLQRLYMHPTRSAYEELRTGTVAPSMADRQRIWLVEPSNSVATVEFCLERVRDMLRHVEPAKDADKQATTASLDGTIAGRVEAARAVLCNLVEGAQSKLNAVLRCEADDEWQAAIKWKLLLQSSMGDLSHVLTETFEPWWRLDRGPHPIASGSEDQSKLDESLIKNAELFVASRVVDFLRQVFPQMMYLVVFASVGLLALMLGVSSYPFPQRDTIAMLSWVILLSVIGYMFFIFVQINRDRVVSMLLGGTPGELNWNSTFVWQLVVFGLVPILALLGTQFPHTLQGIFSSFGGLLAGAH